MKPAKQWSIRLLIGVSAIAGLIAVGGAGGDRTSAEPSSCAMALAPHDGDDRLDQQIRGLQTAMRNEGVTASSLERLGWFFVSKARASHDDGYYLLARRTANCLAESDEGSTAALLLLGHVSHNMHQFAAAERIARQLLERRESPYEYGLLGDVLMEQGRLDEAETAYQRMMDLKPGLQAYSRAAYLRWLYGDLAGAIKLMSLAAEAGGPRVSEPTAWCYSRLALYQLQAGEMAAALNSAAAALEFEPGYAPAEFARGRALLAAGQVEGALDAIASAARKNPLPEYKWLLADALRSAGETGKAEVVEQELIRAGLAEDPRTLALYLATANKSPDKAVALAAAELRERSDVFTHDALAWALLASGRTEEASAAMNLALAEGTSDARLYLHAGVIAAKGGDVDAARLWLTKADEIRLTLFPSEQVRLEEALRELTDTKS